MHKWLRDIDDSKCLKNALFFTFFTPCLTVQRWGGRQKKEKSFAKEREILCRNTLSLQSNSITAHILGKYFHIYLENVILGKYYQIYLENITFALENIINTLSFQSNSIAAHTLGKYFLVHIILLSSKSSEIFIFSSLFSSSSQFK